MICFVAAEHNFYPQKKPQQCPHWDLAKTFDAKMLMRLWDGKIGVALNRMKVSMELKSKLLQNVMVTPCYKCDDSAVSKSLIVRLVGWFSMFRPMKLKLTATKSIPVYKCAHKLNEHILTIDFSVQKGTHGTNGQYTVTEQNQF